MLTLHFIRENKDLLIERLTKRNLTIETIDTLLTDIITLDDSRKKIQTSLDEKLAQNNKISKEIGQLYSH